MADIWTNITTQDDPDTGHEAIDVGRTMRDNDDALVVHSQFNQLKSTTTGLNQTFPNRVATGCRIRFRKQPGMKKLRTHWLFENLTQPGVRTWGVVRFNNNAALESPLMDKNVSNPPWEILDFDISSLAEGTYDAEIYAGHAGVAGDSCQMRLPAGRNLGEAGGFDTLTVRSITTYDPDWTASPSSDLPDAKLTADKGHEEDVSQAFFDRDLKLARRPAGFYHSERTSTMVGPGFTQHVLWKIYVPEWAEVLALDFEAMIDGASSSGNVVYDCQEMASEFPFFDSDVSSLVSGIVNTSYQFFTARINLAPMRGRVATIRLWQNIAASGAVQIRTRIQRHFSSHHWEAQPLASQHNTRVNWRNWPAAARLRGGLLSSGWWRRVAARDRDLLERQMLYREWQADQGGAPAAFTRIENSSVSIVQPRGTGVAGVKLIAPLDVTLATGPIDIKVDYFDEPDGSTPVGTLLGQGNGIYELSRILRTDRENTLQTFSVWMRGSFTAHFQVLQDHASRFSLRLP